MIATLPYGPTAIEATLPDRSVVLSNEEPKVAPVDDLDAAVREALADPVGLGRIRDLVTPGASVAIALDDATVPAYGPIRRVAIEAVLEELESAGVPRRNVTLICANALHRMNLLAPGGGPRSPPQGALSASPPPVSSASPREWVYEPLSDDCPWPDSA